MFDTIDNNDLILKCNIYLKGKAHSEFNVFNYSEKKKKHSTVSRDFVTGKTGQ